MLLIKFMGTSCDTTLEWVPQNNSSYKPALIQVMGFVLLQVWVIDYI